jgi:transcriptional regulator with XRE-family HTH domain
MIKKTLGEAIKKARVALKMTQREVAEEIGVQSSHIAYIENGLRRPSLLLLQRIADTLGLDRRTLLYLAHPEARVLVGPLGDKRDARRRDAWRKFVSNRTVIKRYKITRRELRFLKQVGLLQRVSCPSHFLFVLSAIRQAGVHEEWTL